jgi:hypothetical protein
VPIRWGYFIVFNRKWKRLAVVGLDFGVDYSLSVSLFVPSTLSTSSKDESFFHPSMLGKFHSWRVGECWNSLVIVFCARILVRICVLGKSGCRCGSGLSMLEIGTVPNVLMSLLVCTPGWRTPQAFIFQMMFKSRAGNKAPSKEANGSRQVGRKLEKNEKPMFNLFLVLPIFSLFFFFVLTVCRR